MKRLFQALLAAAVAMLFGSNIHADVYTFTFTAPATVTTTAQFVSIDTTGFAGRVRAYVLSGDWTAVSGGPWSAELRTQLVGVTDQGGGVLERVMGGVNNSNPFTFATPSQTSIDQGQPPRTFLANIAAADLGGTFSLGLRQTFAGSTASIANTSITFYTDAITPVPVNVNSGSSVMTNRPNSLTTTTAGSFLYESSTFTPEFDGTYHFGLYTGGIDGYLLVYNGSFDPTNPLANLIGLDDDGDLGANNSSSFWLNLTAGNTYTVVSTTFTAGADMPNGLLTIAGLPVGAAVPEPGSLALIGATAAGVWYTWRRKKLAAIKG
ncbi:MAG TPA: PEP-CTERM sorting domain-containing protein [Gemmatales bacterium]|nr:PEP-CTERM sorting domain-containing protein [Gemmatales bacterium]